MMALYALCICCCDILPLTRRIYSLSNFSLLFLLSGQQKAHRLRDEGEVIDAASYHWPPPTCYILLVPLPSGNGITVHPDPSEAVPALSECASRNQLIDSGFVGEAS